jgi:NADH-quinone oxidoreductase subunit G
MIKLNIDGKQLEVEHGSSIIEAADQAGIDIPRFCYHKKLSIAANCRMCLIEVTGAPKPMPACATPVAEGMQVKTKSPVALMAQRAVMEFLLINHPLDCPICDQGGECELQDVSMGYGAGVSQYNQSKRSVKDENIGPLIATGMTRCIHCTRCVRFGDEIAGIKELGALGRGEDTEIRTFLNNSVDSELSGNMIDVCPVGALTSKPYRFSARSWELQQLPSIAIHDAIGSNIYVHSLRNKVKRVVPRENEEINEVWLSDRDRFSYEALNHADRLLKPLCRINGTLKEVDWEEALVHLVTAINQQVAIDANNLLALLSPNSTVEEGYLLQKLLRNLGSNSIDYRLRNVNNFNMSMHNIKIVDIENCDHVLLIGAGPRKSMPMLNHRIRKAYKNKAKIYAINPVAYNWNYSLNLEQIVSSDNFVMECVAVLKQLYIINNKELPNWLAQIQISDAVKQIAESLNESKRPVLVFGSLAVNHPHSQLLYSVLKSIISLIDGASIVYSDGANANGLTLAGALPYRQISGNNSAKLGHTVDSAFDIPDGDGTYILFNIDPEFDCKDGLKALDKLKRARHVICITPYINNNMNSYADIVLPLAPFTETSGTLVNIEGKIQSFVASVANIDSQARPGWKILCALANLLDINKKEFTYQSSLEVKEAALGSKNTDRLHIEVSEHAALMQNLEQCFEIYVSGNNKLDNINTRLSSDSVMATLITEPNCYRIDNIVRRATSLQQTNDAKNGEYIFISSNLAEKLRIKNDDQIELSHPENSRLIARQKVIIDPKLPDNTTYMTTGYEHTLGMDQPYMQIVLANSNS